MIDHNFYITQGLLQVWTPAAKGFVAAFSDDDAGLARFDRFVSQHCAATAAVLVDVVEEEFSLDSIPRLGLRDRNALANRRNHKKFGRSPYRLSMLQGKAGHDAKQINVLHSAISNQELLEPWLETILRHRVPIAGIYSVPLMAPAILKKLFGARNCALFVAAHQRSKLRQVFTRDGLLRSARLSESPRVDDAAYARFVVSETIRSRQYFERMRLLESNEVMEVCVVADERTAADIAALAPHDESTRYLFVDPDTAAKKLGAGRKIAIDRFEEAYLSQVGRRRPKNNYARSGENRYWQMLRLRNGLIAGLVAAAAICSVFASVLLTDTWAIRQRISAATSQLEQLTETFRKDNETFDPIQANSYEMKLAVDTGNFILDNRVPVPWVMNQISMVLGDYPGVQIRQLGWTITTPKANESAQNRRGNTPATVNVPVLTAVSVKLTAEIVPFDGDMRAAFALIDRLTRDLRLRTDFDAAMTTAYPLNASPAAALSGEITGHRSRGAARFTVRLNYEPLGVNGESEEDPDART